MKIAVQTSKAVRPAYGSGSNVGSFATAHFVPLTVLDKATFVQYISDIRFFRPPAPPGSVLEAGLAMALAEYREWAGRLGVDAQGNRGILLDDAGARFMEATADVALDGVMPLALEPTPDVVRLYPSDHGAEELLLVQVTRFTCGSFAVGTTHHHLVADGLAVRSFLIAWGQATRGAAIDPVPVHDRVSFFTPRDPPRVEFQHRGAEFTPRVQKQGTPNDVDSAAAGDEVVVHRAHFSLEFISELRRQAAAGEPRTYSRAQCVMAHLWRRITEARRLDGRAATALHIAVNGRSRMRRPPVPEGYTGNVVLWARPAILAVELLARPLRHAVELISREVARIDDAYFRSFIDFASSGAVEEEGLVPTTDDAEAALSPDVEFDSLLGFPHHQVDFGGGPPLYFMPGCMQVEGLVFLVPSFSDDGGIDAFVSLFRRDMGIFKNCCHSLAAADARL